MKSLSLFLFKLKQSRNIEKIILFSHIQEYILIWEPRNKLINEFDKVF